MNKKQISSALVLLTLITTSVYSKDKVYIALEIAFGKAGRPAGCSSFCPAPSNCKVVTTNILRVCQSACIADLSVAGVDITNIALAVGAAGATGDRTIPGTPGIPGIGGLLAWGYFYLVGPSAPISGGEQIPFPLSGPTSGITRSGITTTDFVLPNIGVYEVNWSIPFDQGAELDVWLDSGLGPVEQTNTIIGVTSGFSLVAGNVLIETTVANTILSLRNASGNSAINVLDLFGQGLAQPGTAQLVIKQIA